MAQGTMNHFKTIRRLYFTKQLSQNCNAQILHESTSGTIIAAVCRDSSSIQHLGVCIPYQYTGSPDSFGRALGIHVIDEHTSTPNSFAGKTVEGYAWIAEYDEYN